MLGTSASPPSPQPEPTTPGGEPAPQRGIRLLWLIAAAVIVLAVTVVVVADRIVVARNRAALSSAAKHAAQARDLRVVYLKVAAIGAALKSGTTFAGYSTKVEAAQAARDAYVPPNPEASRIATLLDDALEQYSAASAQWEEDIRRRAPRTDKKELETHWFVASVSVESAGDMLKEYAAK